MIHLEILHLSPFQGIGLLRIYSGVPQTEPAYDHRLDYDCVCTVVWRPRDKAAEIKGLLNRGTKTPALGEVKEVFAFIRERLGVTAIAWERAGGKRVEIVKSARPPKPSSMKPVEYQTGI